VVALEAFELSVEGVVFLGFFETLRSTPAIRGRVGISAQSNCTTCPGR
jgi:hypothetical protein